MPSAVRGVLLCRTGHMILSTGILMLFAVGKANCICTVFPLMLNGAVGRSENPGGGGGTVC